jgi:hypothetical protein
VGLGLLQAGKIRGPATAVKVVAGGDGLLHVTPRKTTLFTLQAGRGGKVPAGKPFIWAPGLRRDVDWAMLRGVSQRCAGPMDGPRSDQRRRQRAFSCFESVAPVRDLLTQRWWHHLMLR